MMLTGRSRERWGRGPGVRAVGTGVRVCLGGRSPCDEIADPATEAAGVTAEGVVPPPLDAGGPMSSSRTNEKSNPLS